MKHNTLKNTLILAALVFSMTGCLSDNSTLSEGVADNSSAATPETPDTPDTETPETPETPQTPEPPAETVAKDATPLWEAKVSAGKEWTTHVNKALDSLGQDLLDVVPADRSLFCPNYANLSYAQRKQYWAFMLSAMVRFESNFKPETSYTESFDDSNGNNVVSRGLLQISIESGNAYGCGFKTSKDLHDPYQNLSCGIRILNRWVDRDGRIAGKVDSSWRGGARYWSVLRAGDKTSYQSILKWSKELSFCK